MKSLPLLLVLFACDQKGPGSTDPAPTGNEPTDPTDPTDPPGPVPIDCSATSYRGDVYDCSTVDRCNDDATNLKPRLACCACDPALCVVDPTCVDDSPWFPAVPPEPAVQPSSCATCHNGQRPGEPVYSGPGLSDPHPFGAAGYFDCATCHGGDDTAGNTAEEAHVPPPPELTSYQQRSLAGVDLLPRWEDPRDPTQSVGPLDWLQFRNPGDLRVVSAGRGCGMGGCHRDEHALWVERSPMATNAGLFAGASFSFGTELALPSYRGVWNDTPAERGVQHTVGDIDLPTIDPNDVGTVPFLVPLPDPGLRNGPLDGSGLAAGALDDDVLDHRALANSDLEELLHATLAGVCSDCHLGHNGRNDGYGALRSGGCSACHMPYADDGRTRSLDSNVPTDEPAPDGTFTDGQRPHVDAHQLRNVARLRPQGVVTLGIPDRACATCHTGTSRTVLQYWGVRVDPERDVVLGRQYPLQPASFTTTAGDPRFFAPDGSNQTWQGWSADQLLVFEDYDGDGRDDTPPDVHLDAGLGCVDCHGSPDVHGGSASSSPRGPLSRAVHATHVRCASCHGDVDGPAPTTACFDMHGTSAACAMDANGTPLRNVTLQSDGMVLRSRLTGELHPVPSVPALLDPANAAHSVNASYAMGRLDDDPTTGTGPLQQGTFGAAGSGFAHTDVLTCDACHSSWSTQCVGCHLTAAYDDDPARFYFSGISGREMVLDVQQARTYQTPVLDYLGVGPDGRITNAQLGSNVFFRYRDASGALSRTFAFADRLGNGNRGTGWPALAHDQARPHTTRGRATATAEGVTPCQVCHNTVEGLAGDLNGDGTSNLDDFVAMRAALDAGDLHTLDFDLLARIASDTDNHGAHPLRVAMTAGLGSGLFLFDADGCPVNPLDSTVRPGCDQAPDATFPGTVAYDLDRFVEADGSSNASSSVYALQSVVERDGALYPSQTGPLGATSLQRLADPVHGIVLDGWLDDEGVLRGTATP